MTYTRMRPFIIATLLVASVAAVGNAAAEAELEARGEGAGTCDELEGDALHSVASFEARSEEAASTSQDVSIDRNNALLAIALGGTAPEPFTIEDVRDVDIATTHRTLVEQDAELDRANVFSALALGLTSDARNLDTLSCVGSFTREVTQEHEFTRTVDLDQRDTFLAIALASDEENGAAFDEVASFEEAETRTLNAAQDVDIDRDDTFLALALGAHGGGNAADDRAGGDHAGD